MCPFCLLPDRSIDRSVEPDPAGRAREGRCGGERAGRPRPVARAPPPPTAGPASGGARPRPAAAAVRTPTRPAERSRAPGDAARAPPPASTAGPASGGTGRGDTPPRPDRAPPAGRMFPPCPSRPAGPAALARGSSQRGTSGAAVDAAAGGFEGGDAVRRGGRSGGAGAASPAPRNSGGRGSRLAASITARLPDGELKEAELVLSANKPENDGVRLPAVRGGHPSARAARPGDERSGACRRQRAVRARDA